jgi:hypothetical protein
MKESPKVLNKKFLGDSSLESVYCGRPSKWGNPFKVGVDGNRTEVILKHRAWFLKNEKLIEEAQRELQGKNLVCWCAPKSCHCDVILEIANQYDITEFFEGL